MGASLLEIGVRKNRIRPLDWQQAIKRIACATELTHATRNACRHAADRRPSATQFNAQNRIYAALIWGSKFVQPH